MGFCGRGKEAPVRVEESTVKGLGSSYFGQELRNSTGAVDCTFFYFYFIFIFGFFEGVGVGAKVEGGDWRVATLVGVRVPQGA
jgi:hypothetical protein